jgi:hypothetical protein
MTEQEEQEVRLHVAAIIAQDVKLPAAQARIAELEAALIRASREIQLCKDALAQCQCAALPARDWDDRA